MSYLKTIGSWLRQTMAMQLASLRGRLLFTLVGLLVVLLVLEGTQHASRLGNRQEELSREHRRAAESAAAAFRANLDRLYSHQALIARMLLRDQMPAGRAFAHLEDVAAQYEGLASVQVYDTSGVVRYAYPRTNVVTVVAEPFFRSLGRLSPFYLSNVYPSPFGDGERVRIASAVLGAGGTEWGAVAMEFRTSGLKHFLADSGTGPVELVIDGAGQLVLSTPQLLEEAAVERATDNRTGRRKLRRPNGDELLGYTAQIPRTDWLLSYLQSDQAALAPIDEEARRSLLVLSGLMLALVVAILAVLQISLKPLVRLSAAARKLGSGDLQFRLQPAEVREFETVVEAFNRMAQRLADTHRELLEANHQLQIDKQNLDALVQERTRALEAEHDKLLRAERLSTLGLFSSAIAHDLRNPLNTVSLAAYWLKTRLADTPDPRVQSRLETIERELRRSDQIIKTLLAFARTGEPVRAPTELRPLFREVADAVAPPPEVAIDLEVPDEMPPVQLDRAQLYQVLENLARNALQAMPEGGEIRLSARAEDGFCRIEVSDTGPGVPPEMLDSIFEPLVTTKASGTGLGLALCKRIVEAHGGRVEVRNQTSGGALFQIQLPLDQGALVPA